MTVTTHKIQEGEIGEIIIKLDPSTYKKYLWEMKGKTNDIFTITKSAVWNPACSTTNLETFIQHITEVGFQNL